MDLETVTMTGAALKLGSQILDLLRGLSDFAKKDPALAQKMMEMGNLLNQYMNAQTALILQNQQLLDEKRALGHRILELESQQAIKEAVFHAHGAYWTRQQDGSADGPFSMNEWDMFRRLVRLHKWGLIQHARAPTFRFYDLAQKESARVPLSFLSQHRVPGEFVETD